MASDSSESRGKIYRFSPLYVPRSRAGSSPRVSGSCNGGPRVGGSCEFGGGRRRESRWLILRADQLPGRAVAVAQSRLRKPGPRSLWRSLKGLAAPRPSRARRGRATTCGFFDRTLRNASVSPPRVCATATAQSGHKRRAAAVVLGATLSVDTQVPSFAGPRTRALARAGAESHSGRSPYPRSEEH